ncbi:hypothetical protein L218DRAFT_872601, partial [Marasmius fiardii PR-910]
SSRALIADFGLYMLYPRSMSGHIRPTPWCAPEVLRGGSLTQKSDIYAYGILCYEVTEFPFQRSRTRSWTKLPK